MAVLIESRQHSRRMVSSLGLLVALIAAALAFALYSFVEWQSNAGDASAFASAPNCGVTQSALCKQRVTTSVVTTYQHHAFDSDQNFVTLVEANGTALPNVQVTGGSTQWQSLTAGMSITAVLWRGKIASLSAPTGPDMQTVDHPANQADTYRTRSNIAWVVTIILVAIAVWIVTLWSAADRAQDEATERAVN